MLDSKSRRKIIEGDGEENSDQLGLRGQREAQVA